MDMNKKDILTEAEDTAIEKDTENSEKEENQGFDWYSRLEELTGGLYELNMDSLTDALDWLYYNNMDNLEDHDGIYQPINLLIMGQPGGGKTGIIKAWAKSRNVALKSLTGSELTDTMVQGLPFADETEDETGKKIRKQKFLPSTAFDALDDPNGRYSVLFLDELNRSWPEAEGAILSLIQDHEISDINYDGDKRHFDKFLFTVAACNPPTENKEVRKLSLALNTRFRFFYWEADPRETARFWSNEYDNRINKIKNDLDTDKDLKKHDRKFKKYNGRKNIINALADSEEFMFDDDRANGEAAANGTLVLNARTLASCLEASDGTVGEIVGTDRHGRPRYTQGSFLGEFAQHCGAKLLDKVEEILEPVAEAEDSANAFLKTMLDKYYVWKAKYMRSQNK